MNICIWSDTSFEKQYASYHLLKDIILQLLNNGNHIWLVQVQYETGTVPNELVNSNNLHIINVKVKKTKKNNFIGRYFSTLSYFKKSQKQIENIQNLDAIFLQSTNVAFYPVHYANRKKIPIVYNVQDIFPQNALFSGLLKKGIPFEILYQLQKYAYVKSNRIITISEDMKSEIVNMGIPREKIEIVYNWSYQNSAYDAQNIDFSVADSILSSNKFNVVYAGNIGIMQNVDIVVETASLMKNDDSVWFHIIGDGIYKEKLVLKAKDLGITNISFWEMQPASEAPAIYARANINIIPLMRDVYKTALPSKTAICLAVQKPIIFCIGHESSFGKIVQETTGCPVIDSDDANALRQSIIDIKRGTCKCFTVNMYNTHFKREDNCAKYASIISDVINKKV